LSLWRVTKAQVKWVVGFRNSCLNGLLPFGRPWPHTCNRRHMASVKLRKVGRAIPHMLATQTGQAAHSTMCRAYAGRVQGVCKRGSEANRQPQQQTQSLLWVYAAGNCKSLTVLHHTMCTILEAQPAHFALQCVAQQGVPQQATPHTDQVGTWQPAAAYAWGSSCRSISSYGTAGRPLALQGAATRFEPPAVHMAWSPISPIRPAAHCTGGTS
jgi:hypothetical protein